MRESNLSMAAELGSSESSTDVELDLRFFLTVGLGGRRGGLSGVFEDERAVAVVELLLMEARELSGMESNVVSTDALVAAIAARLKKNFGKIQHKLIYFIRYNLHNLS